MLLVSITERSSEQPTNYSTVKNLPELYRGLCAGLDVQKFLSMSNFDLFVCGFKFSYEELKTLEFTHADLYDPLIDNLADSVYGYMKDNLDVYFDIVKAIDDYREKIKNYKVDK